MPSNQTNPDDRNPRPASPRELDPILKAVLELWYYYAYLHRLALAILVVMTILTGQLFSVAGLALVLLAAFYGVLFYLHKRFGQDA